MSDIVLDASALLAMLRREAGGERVRAVIRGAAMTAVNFSEVIGFYARMGAAAASIKRRLDPLPIERIPFDEDLAYSVGMLLPVTAPAGLSFADRACLALAQRLDVRALTADRSWSQIAAAVPVEIELIR